MVAYDLRAPGVAGEPPPADSESGETGFAVGHRYRMKHCWRERWEGQWKWRCTTIRGHQVIYLGWSHMERAATSYRKFDNDELEETPPVNES